MSATLSEGLLLDRGVTARPLLGASRNGVKVRLTAQNDARDGDWLENGLIGDQMEEFDGEVALLSSLDISRVRHHVRQLAASNGLSATKQTKLVTAVSELARNAVKYANGGRVTCARINAHDRVGIRAVFEDAGPGIPDLSLALSDGWSSGGGLGLGLPGARRLVDDFNLESIVGVGTRVEITMWK